MHIPVLAREALDWLDVRPDGLYVDCTAGAGGHSALIAERLTTGRLIALDRDPAAVALARSRLAEFPQAQVFQGNYGSLAGILEQEGIEAVDGVLIDAGVSSMQLDDPARGFSLQAEGPLDMRMDSTQRENALDYLARISRDELASDLRELGDVQRAGRIARTILEWRDGGRLQHTSDLAAAVSEALGVRGKTAQEAYTVFQAIRMRVNDELHWLEAGVRQGIAALAPGGRFAGIAFHSGEDRVIKRVLQELSRTQRVLHPDGRVKSTTPPQIKLLTKKPIQPKEDELRDNPRSRSARLRAAERLAA